MTNALRKSVHPFSPLVLATSRHSVHGVFALDDFTLRVSFARFYKFGTTASVQFEAVLFLTVTTLAYRNVFQWDDTSRFFVCRIFEIVQAVVVQDEPSSFPRFVSAALLPQPTLLVRIEERMHQIITIVFRYFKRFSFDAIVEADQQFSGQILALVDAPVHVDELLYRGFFLDAGIVQTGIEHDDGEREDVTGIRVFENVVVALALAVPFREAFHHPVDFLGLAR